MKRAYEMREKELKNLASMLIEKIVQERYWIKNIFIAIKDYILSDYNNCHFFIMHDFQLFYNDILLVDEIKTSINIQSAISLWSTTSNFNNIESSS